jgi:hypothetical protein
MNEKTKNTAAFYWSVCLLRRLCDMGLLSPTEYEKILAISRDHYCSALIVS